MSYDDYIETNILQPLGMTNTTTRQPLPPELAAQMSGGYTYADGAYQAQDFQLVNIAPAGSVHASATDMARFMIAHLQNGRYGEARILEEATALQMKQRLFSHDERLLWGSAYGFFDQTQNGQRIVYHGGEAAFFISTLWLLPDQNVGLFLSTNSPGGETLRSLLLEAFMDRYYPIELHPVRPAADFATRATRFAGSYQLNRHSYTTWEKIITLLLPAWLPMSISAADDGTLSVKSADGTQSFVEIEPLVFREVDGDAVLVFRGCPRQHQVRLWAGRAFEKQAWYEVPLVHYILFATCMLVFLSVIIAAPVNPFRQPQTNRSSASSLPGARGCSAGWRY
jgi:hypothetical protein